MDCELYLLLIQWLSTNVYRCTPPAILPKEGWVTAGRHQWFPADRSGIAWWDLVACRYHGRTGVCLVLPARLEPASY